MGSCVIGEALEENKVQMCWADARGALLVIFRGSTAAALWPFSGVGFRNVAVLAKCLISYCSEVLNYTAWVLSVTTPKLHRNLSLIHAAFLDRVWEVAFPG